MAAAQSRERVSRSGIKNRIIGVNPQESVVNQLVAILKAMPQLEDQK
jgi:hypothetical protein